MIFIGIGIDISEGERPDFSYDDINSLSSSMTAILLPQNNERKTMEDKKAMEESKSEDGGEKSKLEQIKTLNKSTNHISIAILQNFDSVLKEKISIIKREKKSENKEEG